MPRRSKEAKQLQRKKEEAIALAMQMRKKEATACQWKEDVNKTVAQREAHQSSTAATATDTLETLGKTTLV